MFKPSKKQELAKATFQRRIKNNPLIGDISAIPKSKLEKLAEVKDLSYWLEQDGFYEWFTSPQYNKDLLESAAESAIRSAMAILDEAVTGEKSSPKFSDKIAAAKLILEYAGYTPPKDQKLTISATQINGMTEDQIDAMLASAAHNRAKLVEDSTEYIEVPGA